MTAASVVLVSHVSDVHARKTEELMTGTALRLATLAIGASIALTFAPLPALSDGGGGGGIDTTSNPPADTTKAKGKKKSERFLDGYRTAYATIYQRHDYATAIAQLKALKRDDHPDVANLIGYSNRKLGNYEESKVWYEAALKADPSHVRTWQYYGLWQLEQGNQAQAKVHLDKIASICGTSCPEYRSLAEAMGTVAAGGRPIY
jgi:tetratricopeptide (TPR) repeat protein